MRSACGLTGLPRLLEQVCFQAPLAASPSAVSRVVRSRVILPIGSPLQSSFASLPVRDLDFSMSPEPTAWVWSLVTTSSAASTHRRRFQLRLRSVPRRSQPPDGFLRLPTCRPISSRSRVQGSARSGASLPMQPPFLVGRSLPPCRWGMVTHRTGFGARNHIPRLRGLYPHQAAFHRLSNEAAPAAAPLRVSSPPGPVSRLSVRLTRPSPLVELQRSLFACALSDRRLLQRLPTRSAMSSSPNSSDLPENFEPTQSAFLSNC